MSFLKSKHSGWLSDGTRTPFSGGGSGGGGPTQTTSYNTNIPEYARPYVETMLGATQKQLFDMDDTGITGFKSYTPYSSDVNNYFAGFSPNQLRAQESAYNMQVPGQYGLASGLAGMAGMGGLGAQNQAGQLGQQALGYGQAGQMYGGIGQMYGAQGAQQAQLAAQNAQQQAQRFGQQAVRTGQQSLGYGAQGAGYGAGATNLGLSATELARQQGLGYGAQGAQYGQAATGVGRSAAEMAAQQGLGYGAAGAGFGSAAAGLAPTAQAFGQEAADISMGGLGYGALGTGYGAGAAGLAPVAQTYGQAMADIGAAGGAGAGALASNVARQAMRYGQQGATAGRLGLRAGEEMGAIGAQGLGYGALGTGYGGRGAIAAEQGFGAGEQFARQATDPYATQAYMSPYMQNVVDYQKSQALRDFNIGSQLRKSQAVGAGAFGGSRQAIVESEAERALGSQLQGIAAQGSQKAFEDAQRQQQFGANLGIQGLQAGYGGLGLGMQGAGVGLQGLGTALQGQQGRLAGLSSYQQGLQGAQQGLGTALSSGNLGLAGSQQALAGQQGALSSLGQAGQLYGLGMQGAGVGLSGLGTALQGQQARMAGLGQAGQFLGQGMQGAQTGLQGLQGALAGSSQALQGYQAGMQGAQTGLQGLQGALSGSAQGLQGFGQGIQGAQAGMQGVQGALAGYNTGLSGVGQQLGAGQLGLQGTAQGIQGSQAGMQGAGYGLQGVQGATQAGQYGLQGLGAANQAAGTLGQLGTAQFGTEKDIANLQSTMGAQQQALEQSKINQAIQDYAIQQQYPMMQLGFMSNMLRGLPMQSQTTQLYQAQPSALQQGIGLVGAGASLFGAGRAEGGAIKMAEGGIAGYKYGGAIPEPKLESMADNLSIAQLQARIKDPALTPGERQVFQEALAAKQQIAARSSGIAAAGGGLFNTMGYAGGGILAFADEGLVDSGIDPETGEPYKTVNPVTRFSEYMNPFSGKGGFGYIARDGKSIEEYYNERSKAPPATEADRKAQAQMEVQDREGSSAKDPTIRTSPAPAPRTPGNAPTGPNAGPSKGIRSLEDQLKEQERLMGPNTVNEGLNAEIAKRLADLDKQASQDDRAAMRNAFIKFGTEASPGGIGVAALRGIETYGTASDAARKVRENMNLELTKMQADIKKGERAEKRGNLDAASKSFENAENRQLKIAEMQNQLKVAGIQSSRASEFERQYEAFKANPKQFEQFKKSLTSQDDTARLNAYVKADEFIAKAYPNLMFSKKPEDKAKLDEIRNSKVAEYLGAISPAQGAPAGGSGNLVQNKDGSFNYVPR